MWKRIVTVFLLSWLVAGNLSCPGRGEGPSLQEVASDCSAWCLNAYAVQASKPVCADACSKFIELFTVCYEEKKSCSRARVCAKAGIKEACKLPGHEAAACQVGGDYAHNLILDYCLDREE